MKKYSISTRVLAMLLTVVMLMGMLPMSAFAAEATKAKVSETTPTQKPSEQQEEPIEVDTDENKTTPATDTEEETTINWAQELPQLGIYVKDYVDQYGVLPSALNLSNGTEITIVQFWYMAAKAVEHLANKTGNTLSGLETTSFPGENLLTGGNDCGWNVWCKFNQEKNLSLSAFNCFYTEGVLDGFTTGRNNFFYNSTEDKRYTRSVTIHAYANALAMVDENGQISGNIPIIPWNTYSFVNLGEGSVSGYGISEYDNAQRVGVCADTEPTFEIQAPDGYYVKSIKIYNYKYAANEANIATKPYQEETIPSGKYPTIYNLTIKKDSQVDQTESEIVVEFEKIPDVTITWELAPTKTDFLGNVSVGGMDSVMISYEKDGTTQNQSITATGNTTTVPYGTKIAITATAEKNCYVKAVYLNKTAATDFVPGGTGTYTLTVTGNQNVKIEFANQTPIAWDNPIIGDKKLADELFQVTGHVNGHIEDETYYFVFKSDVMATMKSLNGDGGYGSGYWFATDGEIVSNSHHIKSQSFTNTDYPNGVELEVADLTISIDSKVYRVTPLKDGANKVCFVWDEASPTVELSGFKTDNDKVIPIITAKDTASNNYPDAYSGIVTIEYKLYQDGVGEPLYSETITEKKLRSVEKKLTALGDYITKDKSYRLEVTVTDAADLSITKTFDFDTTVPEVSIHLLPMECEFGELGQKVDNYFTQARFSVIVVDPNFDSEKASGSIKLKEGYAVNFADLEWNDYISVDNAYIADFSVKQSGEYDPSQWEVSYKTITGMSAEKSVTVMNTPPTNDASFVGKEMGVFYILADAPKAELTWSEKDQNGNDQVIKEWDSVSEERGEFWTNDETLSAIDCEYVSPEKEHISSVRFYVHTVTEDQPVVEDIKEVKEDWLTLEDVKAFKNEKNAELIVYMRVVDKAGNVSYVCSDRILVDCVAPKGAVSIDCLEGGICRPYDGNIRVQMNLKDEPSGLKSIHYYVLDMADNGNVLIGTTAVSPEGFAEGITNYKNGSFKIPMTDIGKDTKIQVVLVVTDMAGNEVKLESNTAVTDNKTSVEIAVAEPDGKNGYHLGDVDVAISATDFLGYEHFAGIAEICYEVICDGRITQSGVITFPFTDKTQSWNVSDSSGEKWEDSTVAGDTKTGVVKSWNGTLTVDADLNNSENVVVKVTVRDGAKNIAEAEINLKIAATAPEATVINADGEANISDGVAYFEEDRNITISINDREDLLGTEVLLIDENRQPAQEVVDKFAGLVIFYKATNSAKESIGQLHIRYSVKDGEITLTFFEDANYTWRAEYRNKAGYEVEVTVAEGLTAPFEFSIDRELPTASMSANGDAWSTVAKVITFGIFSNSSIDVIAKVGDVTSGVASVEYCTLSGKDAANVQSLESIDENDEIEWLTCDNYSAMDETFVVCTLDAEKANERAVVYLKVTDYSGKVILISTDGLVVDNIAPEALTVEPAEKKEYYNSDVVLNVVATESASESYDFSGIKEIAYEVTNVFTGETTQKGTLTFRYDAELAQWVCDEDCDEDPKKSVSSTEISVDEHGLIREWKGQLTVDAMLNNSPEILVEMTVTDNAGNTVASEDKKLNINSTQPVVIASSADEPDTIKVISEDQTIGYFGKAKNNGVYDGRGVTITIIDRDDTFSAGSAEHFLLIDKNNPDDVAKLTRGFYGLLIEYTAENVGEDVKVVAPAYRKNEDGSPAWTSRKNEDGDLEYSLTLTFTEDAEYHWTLTYSNKAGMSPEAIKEDGMTLFDFVIDTVPPEAHIKVNEQAWDCVADTIFFGLFSKEKEFEFTATVRDETAGIKSVYYTVVTNTNTTGVLTEEELDKTDWTELPTPPEDGNYRTEVSFDQPFVRIYENQRAVVYLKVVDGIDRTTYVNSNGVVFDNTNPEHIALNPEATNDIFVNDYYNADVVVNINVAEIEKPEDVTAMSYSGIQKVEYMVQKGEKVGDEICWNETQSAELYTLFYTLADPDAATENTVCVSEWNGTELVEGTPENRMLTAEDLINDWTGSIVVDAQENNSEYVKVTVTATDFSGNAYTKTLDLKINCTAPEMTVSFGDTPSAEDGNYGYFQEERKATIRITDRKDTFAANDEEHCLIVKEGEIPEDFYGLVIEYTAKDAKGAELQDENVKPTLTEWTEVVGEGYFEATLTFPGDANYWWDISYINKAAMSAAKETNEASASPYEFTVDATAPTGKIFTDGGVWEELFATLTFGLYRQVDTEIRANVQDQISPVVSVSFIEVAVDTTSKALTESDLKARNDWTNCALSDISNIYVCGMNSDRRVVVYLKIVDKSNNVRYLSTEGIVIDMVDPALKPIVEISPDEGRTIHNKDAKLNVTVEDFKKTEEAGVSSGLQTVTYEVINNVTGEVTDTGVLYSLIYDKEKDEHTIIDMSSEIQTVTKSGKPKAEELKHKWEGNIIVKAVEANNSNDITVNVYAKDNAGREAEIATCNLAIDITRPTISVQYTDTVQPDFDSEGNAYYRAARQATITVTERNFNENDVKMPITGGTPSRSGWTHTIAQNGNGDLNTHTLTLTYYADGHYNFGISYTDLAGNATTNEDISMSNNNPTKFTVDKTAPAIKVTYDNNSVANGKYFKAHRTATVEITEHNFDLARVSITQKADRGGEVPRISWEHKGDSHIATIAYNKDGDYQFNISMKDLAGNENSEVDYSTCAAPKDFVVDTTFKDMVSYSGVINNKAYGSDETVAPSVKIEDINLDEYEVTLKGQQKGTVNDLTEEANALLKKSDTLIEGIFNIFEKVQEMDGIYTLTIFGKDLAGNEDSETIVFTVNRFGSVYLYSEYLTSLIANGGAYVESVTEDLVITEYNADKLLAGSPEIVITRDGRPVGEVVYEATPKAGENVNVGSSMWYEYAYVISKSNFEQDGVYKISISSKDATGNTPENSSYEDMGILFRVDSTKAELTSIVGLEEDIINASEITVTYDVFDAIGIQSVEIYLNGERIEHITDFSADMNNYSGSFVIKERNSEQTVRIVVTDMSGNITDTGAEDFTCAYTFCDEVTVSTNFFVRWYANKPLFWGSVAGVGALTVLFWLLLLAKRKKKDEEEVKA